MGLVCLQKLDTLFPPANKYDINHYLSMNFFASKVAAYAQ